MERCVIVGGVKPKNSAVNGIEGRAKAIIKAKADKAIIGLAGQPAFSKGNIDRMEKSKRISVITLAINQLVCKISGDIL